MEEGFYMLVEVVQLLTYPFKDLRSHM